MTDKIPAQARENGEKCDRKGRFETVRPGVTTTAVGNRSKTSIGTPTVNLRTDPFADCQSRTAKGRNDADRGWLEREHRKWMVDRDWADHAGQKGWPPYDPAFGQITIDQEPKPTHYQMTIEEMLLG